MSVTQPDDRPECQLPDGPLTWGILARLGDCRLPPGEMVIDVPSQVYDKHGHELDGDYDPKGHRGCDHRDTPEWKAEHPNPPRRKAAITDAGTPDAGPIMPETPMPEHNAETAAPAAPVTTETVGVDAAVGQIKSLVPADTSPALLIGGAAVLAVIGAAIKLGPGVLKARAEAREKDHELQMKKLELEERRSEEKDDQHEKCSAARGALEVRISGVERRLDEVGEQVKKAVSSGPAFDLSEFDPEAIENRLARLEKAAKAAKAAPKKR